MSAGRGRPSPDPGFGPSIELLRGHTPGQIDFTRVGKALAREGITTEEPPPPLLQIQPTRPFRNEDVLEPWMLCQPGACLQAVVTAQIVGNNENIASGIVGFNQLQEFDVVRRVARGSTSGQSFAIAHAQCPIDPGLFQPPAVLQRRLDAVASRGPSWCWRKTARQDWPQFIRTDGRRACRWVCVVADDCYSFGTKSFSSLVPQLWVRRQRTPSRTQIRRIWLRLTWIPASWAACASAFRLQ